MDSAAVASLLSLCVDVENDIRSLSAECKKKHHPIKEGVEKAILKLRNYKDKLQEDQQQQQQAAQSHHQFPFDEVFKCLLMACDTAQPKLVLVSLTCLQKLIKCRILPPQTLPLCINLLKELIASQGAAASGEGSSGIAQIASSATSGPLPNVTPSGESIQLKVVQTTLLLLSPPSSAEGDAGNALAVGLVESELVVASLLQVFQMLYRSSSSVVHHTACAGLRQLASHFVETANYTLSTHPPPPTSPKHSALPLSVDQISPLIWKGPPPPQMRASASHHIYEPPCVCPYLPPPSPAFPRPYRTLFLFLQDLTLLCDPEVQQGGGTSGPVRKLSHHGMSIVTGSGGGSGAPRSPLSRQQSYQYYFRQQQEREREGSQVQVDGHTAAAAAAAAAAGGQGGGGGGGGMDSGEGGVYLSPVDLPKALCLELLHTTISTNPELFLKVVDFFLLVKHHVCTVLLKNLRKCWDFPVFVRCLRLVGLLMDHYFDHLLDEMQVLFTVLLPYLHADALPWQTALLLQFINTKVGNNPPIVKKLFTPYAAAGAAARERGDSTTSPSPTPPLVEIVESLGRVVHHVCFTGGGGVTHQHQQQPQTSTTVEALLLLAVQCQCLLFPLPVLHLPTSGVVHPMSRSSRKPTVDQQQHQLQEEPITTTTGGGAEHAHAAAMPYAFPFPTPVGKNVLSTSFAHLLARTLAAHMGRADGEYEDGQQQRGPYRPHFAASRPSKYCFLDLLSESEVPQALLQTKMTSQPTTQASVSSAGGAGGGMSGAKEEAGAVVAGAANEGLTLAICLGLAVENLLTIIVSLYNLILHASTEAESDRVVDSSDHSLLSAPPPASTPFPLAAFAHRYGYALRVDYFPHPLTQYQTHCSDILSATWPPLLSSLTLLLTTAVSSSGGLPDELLLHPLLRSLQTFLCCVGVFQLDQAREATLQSLTRFALPFSPNASIAAPTVGPQRFLDSRSIICLKSLMNLCHSCAFGGILGSKGWSIVLKAYEELYAVLCGQRKAVLTDLPSSQITGQKPTTGAAAPPPTSGGGTSISAAAGGTASVVASPSEGGPSYSAVLTAELTVLRTGFDSLFHSCCYLGEDSWVDFVSALGEHLLYYIEKEVLQNASQPPAAAFTRSPNHPKDPSQPTPTLATAATPQLLFEGLGRDKNNKSAPAAPSSADRDASEMDPQQAEIDAQSMARVIGVSEDYLSMKSAAGEEMVEDVPDERDASRVADYNPPALSMSGAFAFGDDNEQEGESGGIGRMRVAPRNRPPVTRASTEDTKRTPSTASAPSSSIPSSTAPPSSRPPDTDRDALADGSESQVWLFALNRLVFVGLCLDRRNLPRLFAVWDLLLNYLMCVWNTRSLPSSPRLQGVLGLWQLVQHAVKVLMGAKKETGEDQDKEHKSSREVEPFVPREGRGMPGVLVAARLSDAEERGEGFDAALLSDCQCLLLAPFGDLTQSNFEDVRFKVVEGMLNFLQSKGQILSSPTWCWIIQWIGQATAQEFGDTFELAHRFIQRQIESMKGTTKGEGEGVAGGGEGAAEMDGGPGVAGKTPSKLGRRTLGLLFQLIELILQDFTEHIPPNISLVGLVSSVGAFASTKCLGINTSFRAVGFLWNITDTLTLRQKQTAGQRQRQQRREDDTSDTSSEALWSEILLWLHCLSYDSRPEVRNCALRTLTSILLTHGKLLPAAYWKSCVVEVLVRTLHQVHQRYHLALYGTAAPTTPSTAHHHAVGGASTPLVIHHSRDSVVKQWDETLVLTLQGVYRVLNGYVPVVGLQSLAPAALALLELTRAALTLADTTSDARHTQGSFPAPSVEVSSAAARTLADLIRIPNSQQPIYITRNDNHTTSDTTDVTDQGETFQEPHQQQQQAAIRMEIGWGWQECVACEGVVVCDRMWFSVWGSGWSIFRYVGEQISHMDVIPEKFVEVLVQSLGEVRMSHASSMQPVHHLLVTQLFVSLLTSRCYYLPNATPVQLPHTHPSHGGKASPVDGAVSPCVQPTPPAETDGRPLDGPAIFPSLFTSPSPHPSLLPLSAPPYASCFAAYKRQFEHSRHYALAEEGLPSVRSTIDRFDPYVRARTDVPPSLDRLSVDGEGLVDEWRVMEAYERREEGWGQLPPVNAYTKQPTPPWKCVQKNAQYQKHFPQSLPATSPPPPPPPDAPEADKKKPGPQTPEENFMELNFYHISTLRVPYPQSLVLEYVEKLLGQPYVVSGGGEGYGLVPAHYCRVDDGGSNGGGGVGVVVLDWEVRRCAGEGREHVMIAVPRIWQQLCHVLLHPRIMFVDSNKLALAAKTLSLICKSVRTILADLMPPTLSPPGRPSPPPPPAPPPTHTAQKGVHSPLLPSSIQYGLTAPQQTADSTDEQQRAASAAADGGEMEDAVDRRTGVSVCRAVSLPQRGSVVVVERPVGVGDGRQRRQQRAGAQQTRKAATRRPLLPSSTMPSPSPPLPPQQHTDTPSSSPADSQTSPQLLGVWTVLECVPFLFHTFLLLVRTKSTHSGASLSTFGYWKLGYEGILDLLQSTMTAVRALSGREGVTTATREREREREVLERYWLSVGLVVRHLVLEWDVGRLKHLGRAEYQMLLKEGEVYDHVVKSRTCDILTVRRGRGLAAAIPDAKRIFHMLIHVLDHYCAVSRDRPLLARTALAKLFEICSPPPPRPPPPGPHTQTQTAPAPQQPAAEKSLDMVLASAALPVLLDRCRTILGEFIRDDMTSGQCPLPKPRLDEVSFLLGQLRQLSIDPAVFTHCHAHILPTHIQQACKVAGSKCHLMALFPELTAAIASKDAHLRQELQRVFSELGNALGLQAVNPLAASGSPQPASLVPMQSLQAELSSSGGHHGAANGMME
ncbi:unnamed protein product [Vitrella brassicaformis CCMP3155]|uniref:Protein MON2 homolog n=2 Tax=Vitrella brassicaformis TaxID=1169539 RepID=A0A0G4FDH1_VITBC|nr:unnamed protein product [Vitrella brassicaformis CCMP3155]|eukprot:CEM10951.1 unnamed protein product [Vitrella brassicaformis CCMP3155]